MPSNPPERPLTAGPDSILSICSSEDSRAFTGIEEFSSLSRSLSLLDLHLYGLFFNCIRADTPPCMSAPARTCRCAEPEPGLPLGLPAASSHCNLHAAPPVLYPGALSTPEAREVKRGQDGVAEFSSLLPFELVLAKHRHPARPARSWKGQARGVFEGCAGGTSK